MSLPDIESSLDSAAAHWDRAFGSWASAERREEHYALASRLYQERYQSGYFGPDGGDWLDWVRRTLCADGPFERALVLGCGLGDGLFDMHRRGIARRLHGVDLSPAAIERAGEEAAAAGFERDVTFAVGDFHERVAEEGAFDAVFLIMSLHHALDLDRVLGHAHEALAPGGVVIANEYVGPDRWQHTWVQLAGIKLLLTVLPRPLRRRADGSVKGRIGRPTIEWMLENDPSEAACSAAIPARLAAHFELVHRVDYGGGIAVPVLDEIIGNFRADDERSLAWFDAVARLDRWAWRSGLVPSANALLVGRRT